MNRRIVITGGVLILVAIILGAFGAHALKELISPKYLISFETGVRYQMYHGLALLILGLNADKVHHYLKGVIPLLLGGVLLFSLSIYFLALQEVFGASLKFLGPITPLGGSLMIIGWMLFIIRLIISKEK